MFENSPFSLAGKTVLVAGASRGIGLAIAKEAAAHGARTLLASRSLPALEAESAALRDQGYQAEAWKLDFSEPAAIAEFAGTLPEIDALVNVAGMNIRKKFQDYTQEEYDNILQTNLHGLVTLTQRVGERMIDRGKGGKIVMIGSLMSLLGLPYLTAYAITKSALGGLTRTLAAEWGRHNIQVNCIAPGFIITDLNRAMWQAPVMKQWVSGAQANPRTGTPQDVAPLAVYLCARASDYVTGQVIAVDGGYSTTAVWPFEA